MKLAFIGTGYVGLVSGIMMSHLGHDVLCIDIDSEKITNLQNNKSPIFEPGLDDYLKRYNNRNQLRFIHGYDDSLSDADAVFITVGTPSKANGDADLGYIFTAIDNVAVHIKPSCVLVIKSTVPPGTCRLIQKYIRDKGFNFPVASNPEFLREGSAIKDFIEPDRVVIGADVPEILQVMKSVYKPLSDQGAPIVTTDLNSSELIKYAANSFLATKIAFINEMADLCEAVDADVGTLAKAIGLDKRIGKDFLQAGPGFGGSCFPKDILALQYLKNEAGVQSLILDSVIQANSNRPELMINKIVNIFDDGLKDKKFAVLGLTYKAGTDDLRSSPAIAITDLLQKHGAKITIYDPEGMGKARRLYPNWQYAKNVEMTADHADAIIITTEWPEFKNLNFTRLKTILKSPVVIDLRNLLDPEKLIAKGYKYYSVGKTHEH